MGTSIRKTALIFKALGDENRIRVLQLLQNGETCACKLPEALHIAKPTLSHHLKILCDAGIVVFRKDGKWRHYKISFEGKKQFHELSDIYLDGSSDNPSCCKGD